MFFIWNKFFFLNPNFPIAEKNKKFSPSSCSTIEEQAKRVKMRLDGETDPVRKFLMFSSLQDRNETLFYKVLSNNIKELAPIVYTPTVGQICQK